MSFSDEELTLIGSIHSEPKNDAPRLVYADWLESEGQAEHAEFIRLQCQQPYIAITNRDPERPNSSISFEFPYGEPGARARLARLLELMPKVASSPRHASQDEIHYCEEYYRGLPFVFIGSEDETEIEADALAMLGPLSRVDLTIRTDRLAELLTQPLMDRVDKLHIWPDLPWDTQPDPDATMNSHYDEFWARNIPVLATSPVVYRLTELRLCGLHSTGEMTEQSCVNIDVCRALLVPRVRVRFDY